MSNKYTLVNAYDEIVREQVKQLLEQDEDMCKCEKCYLDVCAIVFNHGYTNFVTTLKGQLFAQASDAKVANHVELTVAILEAIKAVKMSPNHLS